MCDTCGCGQPGNEVKILKPGEDKDQEHHHTYTHSHEHMHEDEDHLHPHRHTYTHSHPHSHDGHEHTHDHDHHDGHAYSDTADGNHIHDHEHSHDHDHVHSHIEDHDHTHERRIEIEQDIMSRNNLLAERNRGYFEARGIIVFNLVSSPGSGKTSLLDRTIKDLKNEVGLFIIEGDQQTMNDANRIHKTGVPVVQINTGEGCHLDADMIHKAVKKLEPADNSVLMIENVGNLVCPALFDLGEFARVVIMSVTEGDDKPVKYPYMFRTSDLCIINKTDLLPYVDFNLEKAKEYAKQINPGLEIIEISAKTGEGMEGWYDWLRRKKQANSS